MQRFLTALRSGNYPQGRMYLRQGPKFCALGVACDVINPRWEKSKYMTNGWVWCNADSHIHYSRHIREELGLTPEDVNVIAAMNDKGKSFAEIADWLEARYA